MKKIFKKNSFLHLPMCTKTMKIKVSFDWDKIAQKELGVELDIPEHIVLEILKSHFNKLDYADRQRWIHNNLDNDNVKHISEEQLYE